MDPEPADLGVDKQSRVEKKVTIELFFTNFGKRGGGRSTLLKVEENHFGPPPFLLSQNYGFFTFFFALGSGVGTIFVHFWTKRNSK